MTAEIKQQESLCVLPAGELRRAGELPARVPDVLLFQNHCLDRAVAVRAQSVTTLDSSVIVDPWMWCKLV